MDASAAFLEPSNPHHYLSGAGFAAISAYHPGAMAGGKKGAGIVYGGGGSAPIVVHGKYGYKGEGAPPKPKRRKRQRPF